MKKLITIAAALAFVAGTATADDMAKKAPDAKKAPEPKKDAPKMEMPKPAQELTDMAKAMAGNWKCAGKSMDDKGNAMDFKNATIKTAVDLDKFWIKSEMNGQFGPMKVKMVEYITYDAGQKKWFRVAVDNHGGQDINSSTDGKLWEGEQRMMGMTMKTKATMETVSPKEWKITAQGSMDGKKWAPSFEMSCKK